MGIISVSCGITIFQLDLKQLEELHKIFIELCKNIKYFFIQFLCCENISQYF